MAKLASVKWNGLDTFMQELQTLAAGLTDEANAIMNESVTAAAGAIAAAYPVQSGSLRAGLTIKPSRGTLIAGSELLQLAPHGYIFEHGTVDRENQAKQNRGRMKPNPTFIPIAVAYRRTAISAVIQRVYAHGAAQVHNDDPAA